MRGSTLLFPILLAFTAAGCSSQQAGFLAASNPQAGEIEERGLFTGDGPFAPRKTAPAYAQSTWTPPTQQTYTPQIWPQPATQQPYPQYSYGQQPQAAMAQQPAAIQGQVVEQRYGPRSYVMQYQPQPIGGPYVPYGYAYAYPPPPQKPSAVY